MRHSLRKYTLLIVTGGAGVACANGSAPSSPEPTALESLESPASIASPASHTLDAQFLEIAYKVPEFGGLFMNKAGNLVLCVTDISHGLEAQEAVRDFVSTVESQRRTIFSTPQVKECEYSFHQLFNWYASLRQMALLIDGAVYTDIDERMNRIRVGVENASAESELVSTIEALGIPVDVVEIETTEPIKTLSTLQDFRRPMAGGLKITSTKFCTLGFFADRQGVSTFITNSHCTSVQGGVENTVFAQPDIRLGQSGRK